MIRAALKRFGSWVGGYLLATCLSLCVGNGLNGSGGFSFGPIQAHAQEIQAGIPSGWESYLARPDILSVRPQAKASDEAWNKLKAAHFAFVAQLLEMYPKNTQIYFLARDSEHLYDVARLATEKTSDASRVHLLNVSRANMRDPNLKEYLGENGISEEALRQGKQVLFVDTGFAGTIPRVISESFPNELKERLKTHLVVSSNFEHPSSRAFLVHLNPSVNGQSPGKMHGTIINYEHMPRYTDRSSRYVSIDGRLHPLSQVGEVNDGTVSKAESLKYMADLRAEWSKDSVQTWFRDQRERLRELKSLLLDGSEGAKGSIQGELARLDGTHDGRLFEAYLRDAIEMRNNASLSIQGKIEDFGLKAEPGAREKGAVISKKAELINKHPEWKPVLEDPETEIPKLFKQNNWQLIGNLIDASVDYEFDKILFSNLYEAPASGIKKSLQLSVIEKGHQVQLRFLIEYIFSKPKVTDMRDLIKRVIETGEPMILAHLAVFVFSKPHAVEMKDLIKLLIEKGEPKSLLSLAAHTFSQPHAIEMKDLIKLLIDKGDPGALKYLASHTFSKPHASVMRDLIKLVIEKGDQNTLASLSTHTFSQAHTKDMKDLIKMIIEKGNESVLSVLGSYVFSEPDAREMKDLIKLVIEKADQQTLKSLAVSSFSKPHTQDMKDLLKLCIEKADQETLKTFEMHVFSKPHATGPEYQVLKAAATGEFASSTERKSWMDRELVKIGSSLVSAHQSSIGTKRISPDLMPGDQIEIKRRKLTVVKLANPGRRGVVFQVKAENGAFYALKVAKDQSPETLKSLSQESAKAKAWQELKIPHAKVLVQEKTFVLKPWINGMSGEEVVQKFATSERFDPDMKRAAREVIWLVSRIRSQGAYIDDFRPANLIWNGKAWVIVDSGSIQSGMTLEKAQAKWNEADERGWRKFEHRWHIKPPQLPRTCREVFAAA